MRASWPLESPLHEELTMGDVEEMLGALEQDDEADEAGDKPTKEKRASAQEKEDSFDLDLDDVWA
ncbi:MAG: hypothetical protein R3185_00605 [Candidatus Thermoplasmatota archaeon]|nr:hypothetical protein [Candidatus Thermoplasmatota archaeon]